MIPEQNNLLSQRDACLMNGDYTVLNGEYTKNLNVYMTGEKHKEAYDYIMMLLDRSTDNTLGFGIKMGAQKKYGVSFWNEEDIPKDYL